MRTYNVKQEIVKVFYGGIPFMNRNTIFLIAGGDLRQVYLAEALSRDFKVYVIGFDKNMINSEKVILLDNLMSLKERVDYIVLPLPASSDDVTVNTPFYRHSIPLYALTSVIDDDGMIFGGKMSLPTRTIFYECGLKCVDYFEREELSVLNAVPTAEGAVQIAMEELPTTIYGQKVLVTGMGRVSKVLIKILNAMGADVDVTARKYSDLAWAGIYGSNGIHISQIDKTLEKYDLVFNTVPSVIFDEQKLSKLKKSCLVLDLASKPGGVDFETAGTLGVKTVWALSLPGKVAPVTSGEMIAETIMNILDERGEQNG